MLRVTARNWLGRAVCLSAALGAAHAEVLQVGPGKRYSKMCAAITAAHGGDRIEVAAGDYPGDVCRIGTPGLTIVGVGNGRAHIEADGRNVQGKGIWVISPGADNTVVENMEFSGAAVKDANGAGIRVDPGVVNLTVRNCHFHDNENGILAGDSPDSEITVEHSIFENNGKTTRTHNIYINHIRRFVFLGNYSAWTPRGHLVKTRAAENRILYNRLTMEDGAGGRILDISNGGLTYVIGNLIQQGPKTDNNQNLIGYQREGADRRNPSHQLYVVNNTMVYTGAPTGAAFLEIDPSVTTPVIARNNIFAGPAVLVTQASAILEHNIRSDPGFAAVNLYDYRLCPKATALDAGMDPGEGDGFSLRPVEEYRHEARTVPRPVAGALDAGALEYEGGGCPAGRR